MLYRAKGRAREAGLPFNLTLDDIEIPDRCPVLGTALRVGGGTDSSPSLDRVIPELGYTRGNVIVVSGRVNRLKSDATLSEMERVYVFYRNLWKHLKEEM